MKEGKTLTMTVKPYWSDMDALGHINNAKYFTYFEEARFKWIESIGMDVSFWEDAKEGPLVYEADCKYLKQVTLPTELTIKMTPYSPGKASFMLRYDVFEGDEKCAEGNTKIVWADYKAGRPIRLPALIENLFK